MEDDSDTGSSDGEANISVSLARTMLQYARNSEKAMASFTLDFDECMSSEAIEFVGDALRSNTSIQHFSIDLRGNPHGIEEDMNDILFFIINNPSLVSLELYGCSGEASELGKLVLEAAGGNHAIQSVCFGGRNDPSCLPSNWEPITTSHKLALNGFTKDLVWPETHSISVLSLGHSNVQSCHEYQNNLTAFLKQTAKCSGSKSIRSLQIDAFSPALPIFMGSPNTSLQQLALYSLDFSHSNVGCSAMDGLLLGLLQSPTTTILSLECCNFDTLATDKLVDALQANWLPLKDLMISTDENFLTGENVRDLLTCDCLDALGLVRTENEDFDTEGTFLRQGLEQCSLSEIKLTTTMMGFLCPALGVALSSNSLTKLELSSCRFTAEDLGCLVSLIQDDNCHLLELRILDYNWAEEEESLIESTLFDALESNNRLEKLAWGELRSGELSAVLNAMERSLEKIERLEALEVSSSSEASSKVAADRSPAIARAMAKNWSLDRLIFVVDFETYPEPIGNSFLQRKVHEYCNRNQLKKQIFSPAFAGLGKEECMDMLETMWPLPDCVSLAFWLLQRAPHHFFSADAG